MRSVSSRRSRLREHLPHENRIALLALIAIALATRGWLFGNPIIGIDEQFYVLAGDRLRDGLLPYVDIWDRKPIGLFLIYAFAGWLLGDPVIGHQLLATLSAVLTGWLLFGMARRFVSFGASLTGAVTYVAWLPVFAGVGGQSPVFFNLPMAAAAALLLAIVSDPRRRGIVAPGCLMMLLAGLAMQIKYSALFDGVFFGLTLLWLGWRRGWTIVQLAGAALLWIAVALLPTAAAFAAYAALGHGEAFLQANFLSIFSDLNSPLNAVLRLLALNVGLAPFWTCLWIGWRRRSGTPGEGWIFAWALASFAGFLAFGVYYDHYVLPLLLPLSLGVALAIDRLASWRLAIALMVGMGALGGFGRALVDRQQQGSRAEVEEFAAQIRPLLGKGCLYVNEEIPILYWLTRSCLATRYAFPEHLVLYRYEHALGVDQLGELERTLATRPAVVIKSLLPDDDTLPQSRALFLARLARDYRLVGQARVGETDYEIYAPRPAGQP